MLSYNLYSDVSDFLSILTEKLVLLSSEDQALRSSCGVMKMMSNKYSRTSPYNGHPGDRRKWSLRVERWPSWRGLVKYHKTFFIEYNMSVNNLVPRFSLLPVSLSRSVRTGRREPWERGWYPIMYNYIIYRDEIHKNLE